MHPHDFSVIQEHGERRTRQALFSAVLEKIIDRL